MDRGGVNIIGMSAISTESMLGVLSLSCEGREQGVDGAEVSEESTSGAKASSHVPSVSSTSVSSKVWRVEACWIASLRMWEALAVAFSR